MAAVGALVALNPHNPTTIGEVRKLLDRFGYHEAAVKAFIRHLPENHATSSNEIVDYLACLATDAGCKQDLRVEAMHALFFTSGVSSTILSSVVHSVFDNPNSSNLLKYHGVSLLSKLGTAASSYTSLLMDYVFSPTTDTDLRMISATTLPSLAEDRATTIDTLTAAGRDTHTAGDIRQCCASALACFGMRDEAIVANLLTSMSWDDFWYLRRTLDVLLPPTGESNVDDFLRAYLPLAYAPSDLEYYMSPVAALSTPWAESMVVKAANAMHRRQPSSSIDREQLQAECRAELWTVFSQDRALGVSPNRYTQLPRAIDTRLQTRAINFIRKFEMNRRHRPRGSTPVFEQTGMHDALALHSNGDDPRETVEQADLHSALTQAISSLQPLHRRVICLHFLEQHTLKQIEAELSLSLATVRALEKEAIAILKRALTK